MNVYNIIRISARNRQWSSLAKFSSPRILLRPPLVELPQISSPQCLASTEAFGLKNTDSLPQSALKKIRLILRRYKLRAAGFKLYEAVADEIDYSSFMKELSLADTFYSWFLITELHVWMLMARLMSNPYEGREVRNYIVEALWKDVSMRSKKLGNEHASILRKQIYELNESFQAALVLYDEGILSSDKVLAGALWRRFYSQNCSSAIQLEAMVNYVRRSMHMLDRIELEDLMHTKKINWFPIEQVVRELQNK